MGRKKLRIPKKRVDGIIQRYWVVLTKLIKNPVEEKYEVVDERKRPFVVKPRMPFGPVEEEMKEWAKEGKRKIRDKKLLGEARREMREKREREMEFIDIEKFRALETEKIAKRAGELVKAQESILAAPKRMRESIKRQWEREREKEKEREAFRDMGEEKRERARELRVLERKGETRMEEFKLANFRARMAHFKNQLRKGIISKQAYDESVAALRSSTFGK